MPHVFGPVLSRRLGLSLGVDPVPFKTCNLNCVYCQLGPTSSRTRMSREYPSVWTILCELNEALASAGEVDHVTVSGSGEPTLHQGIGPLIRGIKAMTKIPVAVITNGTLLSSLDVREALCQADVVLPSLDAAESRAFNRIGRPAGGLAVESVIAGLVAFRRQFRGRLWLEVMLVRGLNDTAEQLARLKAAIAGIKPDRLHLNTIVRPPAADWAQPVRPSRLAEIALDLGPRCEVIADHPRDVPAVKGLVMTDRIVQLVKRRPMTLRDLADSLGATSAQVAPCLARLMVGEAVQSRLYQGRLYYTSNAERARDVG